MIAARGLCGRRPVGRTPGDEVGSITMAMLFTLVGLVLTAFIGPMVVTQIKATGVASSRVRALHAAQTGIEVALGQIRAAKDPVTDLGDSTKLPCGPLSGPVGDGSDATYTVTIAYSASDPQGAWTVQNPLDCPAPSALPAYAVLTATGTDGSVTRSLRSTYRFRSTWPNIPGGQLRRFNDHSLCLDAGSADPPPGTKVTMQPCLASGTPKQTFGYYPDLSIVLTSSATLQTRTNRYGLCMDAGVVQAAGSSVTLQPCSASAPGHQRWGLNDWSLFTGTKDDMSATGLCVNAKVVDTPGSELIMDGACDYNLDHAFAPDSAMGAGAAGQPADDAHGTWTQLVNYKQFGRCMDVSWFEPDYDYMVAWPCKQGAGYIGWNQRWYLPSSTDPAPIRTFYSGNSANYTNTYYCLQPPLGGVIGGYATLTLCSANTSVGLWTVVGDSTANWNTDYRIIDSYGHCLAAKDNALGDFMPDPGSDEVSKVITVACSDDPLQKWNAPPRPIPPVLTDTDEG